MVLKRGGGYSRVVLKGGEGIPVWYQKARRLFPCGVRRRGGHSLVILKGGGPHRCRHCFVQAARGCRLPGQRRPAV